MIGIRSVLHRIQNHVMSLSVNHTIKTLTKVCTIVPRYDQVHLAWRKIFSFDHGRVFHLCSATNRITNLGINVSNSGYAGRGLPIRQPRGAAPLLCGLLTCASRNLRRGPAHRAHHHLTHHVFRARSLPCHCQRNFIVIIS